MDLVEASERPEGAPRHPWELARVDVVDRLLSRHACVPPGSIVLDVGCGDAFVVEQLARTRPQLRFHAIDTAFTAEQLHRYRSRLEAGNVSLLQSLEALPPRLSGPVSVVLL